MGSWRFGGEFGDSACESLLRFLVFITIVGGGSIKQVEKR